MTLHGVRRWLVGETLPSQDKLVVLAEWLGVQPHELPDLRQGLDAKINSFIAN